MMRTFLFIALIIALINAHGWVNIPQPRGYIGDGEGSASTNAPCGKAAINGEYPEIVTVTNGEALEVSFRNGGGHTGQSCSFAIGTADNDASSFNTIINMPTCEAATAYTEIVPINVDSPGRHYLQWIWSAVGSTWYSCVQLNVLASNLTLNEVTPGVATTATRTAENTYYRIPLDSYEQGQTNVFVNVQNKGSEQIQAAVSALTIPSDNTEGILLAVEGGDNLNAPVCLGSGNSEVAYLTVFGGAPTEYDITVEPYNAYLDVVDNQHSVSLQADSKIFFFTPSTSVSGRSRRLVFTGVGYENCVASGPYPSCDSYERPLYVETRCVNLPLDGSNDDYGINYFGFECSEDFNGQVRLESGKCNDFEDSTEGAASGLFVLFSMMAFCLLF